MRGFYEELVRVLSGLFEVLVQHLGVFVLGIFELVSESCSRV